MKNINLAVLFLFVFIQSGFSQQTDTTRKDTVRLTARRIQLKRPETRQMDDKIEFEITACKYNPAKRQVTIDFFLYTEKVDQMIFMGTNFDWDLAGNDYFITNQVGKNFSCAGI